MLEQHIAQVVVFLAITGFLFYVWQGAKILIGIVFFVFGKKQVSTKIIEWRWSK